MNPQFTVAIGDNGKGKSTILHALQVSLGAYLQCLPIPASPVYRRQFKTTERFVKWDVGLKEYVPNEEEPSISVTGTLTFDGPVIEWTRKMLKDGSTSHSRANAGQLIDAVTKLLKQRTESKTQALPILASFGTERAVLQLRKGKLAQKRRSRLEKGYLTALSNKVDFNGVIEWLHNYDSEIKYEKEFVGTREAVFEAIMTAIPYLEDVDYNGRYQELEAVVNVDDNFLGRKTHSNMSDGLISMLNMVAELAFRCVTINGFLGVEAIRASRGIVLIDELDMHLHPNWQRHVVSDLRRAFPNLQFVVTTHSPFIVQSLNSDELFNLDKPVDVNFKDLKIDDIATEVMGVDSAFAVENEKKFEEANEAFLALNSNDNPVNPESGFNDIADAGLRALLKLQQLSKDKLK